MNQDVLFFAFANDPKTPLATLQDEAAEIRSLLSPGQQKGSYLLHHDQFATREEIIKYIIQYKNEIVLFHYSGHAGKDQLATSDEISRAEGIAHLLGQCPKLKLVFLNGCSTQGQVDILWQKGIPVILGTSAPVEDISATRFSKRFYQALSNQEKLQSAFELAKGDILTSSPDIDVQVRAIGSHYKESVKAEWGLFAQKGKEEALQWQIPATSIVAKPVDFEPNILLIETLMNAMAPYVEDIREMKDEEAKGTKVKFNKKRLKILENLHAPIAVQLRKLMVPTPEESSKEFDKISAARLNQLIQTYTTITELFTYIFIAQFWDGQMAKPDTKNPEALMTQIIQFLKLSPAERKGFEIVNLIKSIHNTMLADKFTYFFDEEIELKTLFTENSTFLDACSFFESLKRRNKDGIPAHEIPDACFQAEQNLAEIFKQLGFLSKYHMAAVRIIDVVKSRQEKTAKFRHSLVNLVNVVGGLELDEELLDKFMDSRSVLLIKKNGKESSFINLSPFILDENAFDEKTADIPKLFFFNCYKSQQDQYEYRYVDKPDDAPLTITAEPKYQVIKAQFEAFASLFFNKSMKDI